jgi:hypothetical protein
VVESRERTLEDLFRTVNERLRGRMRQLDVAGRSPLVCECSDPDCLQVIDLTDEEYAAVRSSSNRYVVVTGHAWPEVEDVIESRDGFDIVEKRTAPE